MGIYVKVALRNLLQARRRSLFLSVALMLVTALLVILQSLGQGISENMVKSATTLSSGHVNVGGFYKLTPTEVAPLVTEAAKVEKIVNENTPGLDYAITRQRGWVKMVSASGNGYTSLSGIDPASEGRLLSQLKLAPERQYKKDGGEERKGDLSKVGQPGTIQLFASQAKRLEVGVGDVVTLTAETLRGTANSADVTVVAICEDMGMLSQWTAFVNTKLILDIYQLKEDTTGAVMVYLKDPSRAEATMAHLTQVLKDNGYGVLEHKSESYWQKFEPLMDEEWTGQKLDLTLWEDEANFLTWVLTAFNGVSYFLVAILLMIIVIGIMNTMWMSVRERTGEVGTLRAIGMGRSRVLLLFLLEALILGLLASTVGGLLGAGLASMVDAAAIEIPSEAAQMILLSDKLRLVTQPAQVVGSIVVFTVVSGISALWPAFRAARMRPVTAIHHVG